MADLIGRQALKDKIGLTQLFFVAHGDNKSLNDIINETPAVDAVEVVRCGECEDYENGECVCPYIWTSDGAHIWPEADHFCSYGKRREENA